MHTAEARPAAQTPHLGRGALAWRTAS